MKIGSNPDGIAGDVSPERLERYFIREDGTYRIRKEIREMTIFERCRLCAAVSNHRGEDWFDGPVFLNIPEA